MSSPVSRLVLPIGPGIAAATSLGISDVLAKVVLASGSDVLTMLSFRGVAGLAFMAVWLRLGAKPFADARQRWIALGIGIILAGVVFFLFKAIEAIDVPTAILSYFIYPLLTGLIASRDRARAAALAGRLVRHRRVLRPGGDDRRPSRGSRLRRRRLCARRRVLPHRHPSAHPRLSRRCRCAAVDMVLAGLVDGPVRRLVARHVELAAAADADRLDGHRRHERRHHLGLPVHLRVDRARRGVSHAR